MKVLALIAALLLMGGCAINPGQGETFMKSPGVDTSNDFHNIALGLEEGASKKEVFKTLGWPNYASKDTNTWIYNYYFYTDTTEESVIVKEVSLRFNDEKELVRRVFK